MATNATTAEDRLTELDIHLPDAPTPFAAAAENAPLNKPGDADIQSGWRTQ